MDKTVIAGPQSYYLINLSYGTNEVRAVYLFGDNHDDITTCDKYDVVITDLLNTWIQNNETNKITTDIYVEDNPTYECDIYMSTICRGCMKKIYHGFQTYLVT